jgi:chemosensory pili system protein ChpA (sensor histidine kinase/response regulator)
MQQSLLEFFIAEAEDHMNTIEKGILHLENAPADFSRIEEIFRAAHTLKGSASLVKLKTISQIAHLMEDIFEEIKDTGQRVTPALATWMLKGLDSIKLLIGRVREGKGEDAAVFESFKSALPGKGFTPFNETTAREKKKQETEREEKEKKFEPVLEKRAAGRRKEDVEIVESKFVRIDIHSVEQIMNLMGELTIVKNYLLSQIKNVASLRDEISFSGRRLLTEVSGFSDRSSYSIAGKVKYIDPLLSEFHELEFDRYDEINLFARKLQEITDDIHESMKSLSKFFESLESKIRVMDKLITRSKEEISEARMIDLGRLYQRFTRAVRDISLQHGKKIRFLTSGYETKIDKIIFERTFESLLHILRNAIAHGIESPEERVKKGKPEEGTIHLNAKREGNAVVVEIKDDGRGIDFDAIRQTAQRKGLLSPSEKPTREDLLQLIFMSGFTTLREADMTSGRGVGLDAVKETLATINGTVEIHTEKDKGTTFRFKVPLSLVIINVVIFEAGGIEFIIPSTIVQELAEVPFNEIIDSETFTLRDKIIPFKSINSVLGLADRTAVKIKPLMVLNISGKNYGLVVDRLIGQEETIIKTFGKFLEGIKYYSGVSISADGKIRPVVNALAIVSASSIALMKETTALPVEVHKHAILVVDDSLSVRKFIGAILQGRNFEVFTATNGLEALNIIDENRIDLVITDLEMPVMHGYELLGELKRRGLLSIIPVIVLTSRSSSKHEEKAFGLGASDFLIKPFEEENLLETVKRNIHDHHLT